MYYKIQTYITFDKEVKKPGKKYKSIKKDLTELVQQLMQNPDMGTDLGNGYRKIRMSITDKGKRQKSRCQNHYAKHHSVCGRNKHRSSLYL